jgi:3-oxoacyl-[acyl-carrier protein] reductase
MSVGQDRSTIRGKVALVTGGSRGIGRATALALAEAGCRVALSYVQSGEAAEEVAQEIRAKGVETLLVKADLAQAEEVERLAQIVASKLGAIDILINNAGVTAPKPLLELTHAHWEMTIATNLTSSFLMSQAVIPSMQEKKWGRLIFLSSIAAQTGGVIGPHYAASKAGMLGLMHSYANLLVKDGITSNAIAPALIDTDMVRNNSKATPDLIPAGRFGTAEEMADIALLLCRNGYMTGQTISANGGWYQT